MKPFMLRSLHDPKYPYGHAHLAASADCVFILMQAEYHHPQKKVKTVVEMVGGVVIVVILLKMRTTAWVDSMNYL